MFRSPPVLKGRWTSEIHLAVNYQKLLQYGLKVLLRKSLAKLKAALDLTELSASIDKYHFYDSIFIEVDAVKTYAQRFVELAKQFSVILATSWT